MKRILLIFHLISFMFIGAISCQETNDNSKWDFGIHVGAIAGKMLWGLEEQNSPNFYLALPNTSFRTSYGAGISANYKLSERFYIPSNLDYINRRFAIDTDGKVQLIDNGQLIYIQANHVDYKVSQLVLSSGLGINIFKFLALDLTPYYITSISKQEFTVKDKLDWKESKAFQQDFDYGIGGGLKFNFSKVYIKFGYQYGLRNMEKYGAVDAVGASLGNFPIRNTLITSLVGYNF